MNRKVTDDWRKELGEMFVGKKVLILGGLGFIGSSLAIKLVELGSDVTVADAMIEEYGGNIFNIENIKNNIKINYCDIRDINAMGYLVQNKDYIFHSAAQVCHLKSLTDPFPDIDINIRGTAVVMESIRKYNRTAVVVKLGSRGQYGPVLKLPASEEENCKPKGIYEISLLTAEHLMLSYQRSHGIPCVLLRLTNIYGPRAQIRHNRFGVANWFIRLSLEGETIPIYGDGSIQRDFLYIDDCVEAILRTSIIPDAYGQVFNVGRDDPSSFLELAKTIIDASGQGSYRFCPFSAERKAQEPGDFYSDISKIKAISRWFPKTNLFDGIRKTLDYYRKFKDYYL